MKFCRMVSLFLLVAPIGFSGTTFAQDNNDAGTGASAADTTSAGGGAADTSHDVNTPRTDRTYDTSTSKNISDAANRNTAAAARAADQDANTDPNAPANVNSDARSTTTAATTDANGVQYSQQQQQRTLDESQSGISTFWWALLAVLVIAGVGYGVTNSGKHPRV